MNECHIHVFHVQGQLVSMWQDLSQSELSLNQQLTEFYDTVLSAWHAQLQWSSQVSYSQVQASDKHFITMLIHNLTLALL